MQEQQDIAALEEFVESLEDLKKAAHYWKSKNPAKYKKMLGKLKSERKKPGAKERADQRILQAKRRERGGAGTKTGNGHSGKMSGKHSTKVAAYQSSEKKAGQKLSPDRKNNAKGYQSGNVRNVPQNLNRGRHNVDEKKLSKWKNKLKKSGLDEEQFMTLLHSKMLETGHTNLAEMVDVIDIDDGLPEWSVMGLPLYRACRVCKCCWCT